MSFPIPKIVYGAVPTEINFVYPPESGGDGPEELDVKDNTNFSLSGVQQTSLNYIDANRYLSFSFATEAQLAAFQAFVINWASKGKAFQYYDDANSADFVSYRLAPGYKFKAARLVSVAGSETDFLYKIPMQFRRTVGETESDVTTITINNNQVVAANVLGMVFDHTLYSSVKIFCEINRRTDSVENVANGYLTAIYKAGTSSWDVTPSGTFDGDAHGVTFSMSGEQLAYVSDNQAGTNYVGVIKIKELVFA